ncbi:MAG: hypothetical protein D6696_06255 [Acidobacteria bacterium]|nr:MAG: hypothetical protein D6696_06255 [Acidobacteriota bacterium]
MRRRSVVLACLLVLCPAPAPASAGAERVDLRSLERLYYGCENELGRRDVTLFGNGTIRLRQGLKAEERMDLAELGPEELAGYLQELARRDPTRTLGDVTIDLQGPTGLFVEQCELRLQLPGQPPEGYRFSRYDAGSLELRRLIRIAERLAARAEPDEARRLPAGYWPRIGDVLENVYGHRYRVLWVTEDGLGVELDGIDQPIRMLISIAALPQVFVAVERR